MKWFYYYWIYCVKDNIPHIMTRLWEINIKGWSIIQRSSILLTYLQWSSKSTHLSIVYGMKITWSIYVFVIKKWSYLYWKQFIMSYNAFLDIALQCQLLYCFGQWLSRDTYHQYNKKVIIPTKLLILYILRYLGWWCLFANL